MQRLNIHIAVCNEGDTSTSLNQLRASPATVKAKAKFILATDGINFEAEDLLTGETVACAYPDFPNHFGFFLTLAGISTVKQIRESSFDIRATSRLNRLYKPNLSYAKAGVMLGELVSAKGIQTDLFSMAASSPKSNALMTALDNINKRMGKETIKLASEGFSKPWKMKQGNKSPSYTTNWGELVVAGFD